MDKIANFEGLARFGEFQTWYRVTGDLGSGKVPVIVAHGGPGCTHDYVESFTDLAHGGRAVIHYDQLGNGYSTHLPDAGPDFWTVNLFLAELDNLIAHLGITGRYNLLGQSWGGMLGAEHAVRQPAGLNALIIANSPASMHTWAAEAKRLRQALPTEVQQALELHEARGDFDHPDYQAASEVFYRQHVCRLAVWPPEVRRTFDLLAADPTVYHTMNGPTEFHIVGTLKDWTVEDRLARINVPTLVISGRFDEATPLAVEPFAKRIAGAEWVIFEDSSHMPHVEERAHCMDVVGAFLDANEG